MSAPVGEARLAEIEEWARDRAVRCYACDAVARVVVPGTSRPMCAACAPSAPGAVLPLAPLVSVYATTLDLVAEVRRLTAALVPPQRPCVGDVVMFEGNRCTVTAVDEQRFYAEDHDWRTSIAPDWSEMEFARPVWIARLRGRGSAQNAKRGGAK